MNIEEKVESFRTMTARKQYLIRNKIIPYKCSNCNQEPFWFGQELVLQLHHIDGDKTNNTLENLTFLCPNCHTQTDTYGARNLKNYRSAQQYCIDCGKPISRSATRCNECAHTFVSKCIGKEELKALIREKSFCEIGRQYSVSDNAIRKWCKSYGLPSTKKDIKAYSNEEWNLL